MGKGAGRASQDMLTQAGRRLSRVSEQLMRESQPQRALASAYYKSIVRGGPQLERAAAPQIGQIRQSYSRGRQSVENFAPRGGFRRKALQDLRLGETSDIGKIFTTQVQDAVSRLMSGGQFGTQAGIGALSGQAGTGQALGQLSAQQAAAWGSGLGGLAGAFGTFFGSR